MPKIYKTPTGKTMQGVLQVLSGVALAHGPGEDGEPEYEGETDVWWDEQKDVENEAGQTIWVDEDGDEWPEDQLIIEEIEE